MPGKSLSLSIPEKGRQSVSLPENFAEKDRDNFRCLEWQYADPDIIIFRRCFLLRSGVVVNSLFRPVIEAAPWKEFYQDFKPAYFVGKIFTAITRGKFTFKSKRVYYCCVNGISNNYFHWFTEVLPKMIYVKDQQKSEVVFYIPFSLSAYQTETLKICGFDYNEATGSDATLFNTIHIVTNFYKHPGFYHTQLQHRVAESMLKAIPAAGKSHQKIYVTRKNAVKRKLVNEEEVTAVLRAHDFKVLDFDKMDFVEQVSTMQSASVLVSLHGAALTNLMFMPQGSIVVEFLPERKFNDKCYFTLAGTMNMSYYYLTCKTDAEDHVIANYTADISQLEELMITLS